MLKLLRSFFGRDEAVRAALAAAVAEQFEWEKTHPVPYSPDQRIVAIAQRAEKRLRADKRKPPKSLARLAGEAVANAVGVK